MGKINKFNNDAYAKHFKLLEEQKMLEKEAKDVLYNYDYYDKLTSILRKKGFIRSDIDNAISKDEEIVSRYLSFLYDMINAYAKKNYICLSNESFGYSNAYHSCFYLINYKDTYFTISKECENGFDYYIYSQLCFQKQDNFIKIDDVLNNTERESTKSIREKLEEFKEIIISYSKMGISTSILEETSKDAFIKIRKKEKD